MTQVQCWKFDNRTQDYTTSCKVYEPEVTQSEFKIGKKRYTEPNGLYEYTLITTDRNCLDTFKSNQELIF